MLSCDPFFEVGIAHSFPLVSHLLNKEVPDQKGHLEFMVLGCWSGKVRRLLVWLSVPTAA